MTAARRRLIVTDYANNSTFRNAACPGRWTCPLQPPLRACRRDEQAALARRIEELAGAHPRFGYRRIWALLGREGWSVNKKAVRRIWRLSGLKLAEPRHAQAKPAARPGRQRVPPPAVARQGRCMDMGLHFRPYQ